MFQYIFHVATKADWERALASDHYIPSGFEKEGFVHCSTRDQVLDVANRYYRGREDLVLLAIEPRRLDHFVRYENLEAKAPLYPHIYGPVNLEAIDHAFEFQPDEDGCFSMPSPEPVDESVG